MKKIQQVWVSWCARRSTESWLLDAVDGAQEAGHVLEAVQRSTTFLRWQEAPGSIDLLEYHFNSDSLDELEFLSPGGLSLSRRSQLSGSRVDEALQRVGDGRRGEEKSENEARDEHATHFRSRPCNIGIQKWGMKGRFRFSEKFRSHNFRRLL